MKKVPVFLYAIGLIFVLSTPVLADDTTLEDRIRALEQTIGNWSFYGKAQLSTFYNDNNSRDVSGNDTSDESLRWDSQCNARIGANWTHENLSANVELGLDDDFYGEGGTGVRTRTAYGSYDFGSGAVTIGQDWTPLNSIVYSNQVVLDDLDLIGYGTIWEVWSPQIKIRTHGFEIALVEEDGSADIPGADTFDVDVLMPKIEGAYHFVGDKYFADVFGGFFSYKIEDVTAGGVNYGEETVNCWALGIGGGVNIDPAYVKASVYMARNEINLGLIHAEAKGAKIDAATGELVNEDSLGALLVAGAKIDKYSVEAGVGYVTAEYDESGSEKNDAMSAYINATIPIYGTFFVVPEVGMFDYLDGSDGEDEHRDGVYFGAKWQLDF
ncbi:MAG: porin [Bacteriovoracaceae bacterium]|jgi:hypothetical protein|nr:porin [Bacteriovoracaceae bacterium]